MKPLFEFFRFFFISFEFLIVCIISATYIMFAHSLEPVVSSLKVSNDGVKALLAIPSGICVWTFVSGRKILFPDKDKRNVLQDWPDFWRLRVGFNAGLTWSVIFAAGSLQLWFFDFQKITPAFVSVLLCSVIGVSTTFISLYNAQNRIEIAVSRYSKNKI